jgi:hypothetical protein
LRRCGLAGESEREQAFRDISGRLVLPLVLLDKLVADLIRDADSDEIVCLEMAPVIEAGGGISEASNCQRPS